MNQEFNITEEKSAFSWVPGVIQNDFLRKAIALFFAFLLYFTVTIRLGVEEKIGGVQVEIELPPTLVNLEKPRPVTLVIKGSKKVLKDVTSSNLKVRAKVLKKHFSPGAAYLLRLTPQDVDAPFGVSVIGVEPRDLVLNLDRKISKKVPVKAAFQGERNLQRDYAVGSVKFTPSEVLVTGPESIIDDVSEVNTVPIPLDSNVVDSFEFKAKIPSSESIDVTPNQVVAQVPIIRQNITRTIKSVPIKLLETPQSKGDYEVELLSSPHVDVTVNGPKGAVLLLKPQAVKAYIDLTALDESGTFSVNVDCWVDATGNMKIDNIYPKNVSVKITRKSK
ncbi:MAG: hypothetical protein GY750_07775 [Lentisphaerae bacterium]|nr:hypothetical protein [Lentisphaerota bacterium]MCP4101305.1 hypothetical protein [Lentisphaerota bacterium]